MTGKGRFKAKEWAEFEVVKTNDVNNKNEKQVKQQCKHCNVKVSCKIRRLREHLKNVKCMQLNFNHNC